MKHRLKATVHRHPDLAHVSNPYPVFKVTDEAFSVCMTRVELALRRGAAEEAKAAIDGLFAIGAGVLDLDSPPVDLGLCLRTIAAMEKIGVMNVRDIVQTRHFELRGAPNFGSSGLQDVRSRMKLHGYYLKGEQP